MEGVYWISDEAWAKLEPLLPKNRPGPKREDDRRVISGILHVLRSGCRWSDCPPVYGPRTTIFNRFNRWSIQGVWRRLFEQLAAAGGIPEELAIDSTHVKVHRSARGSKKRGTRSKRSAARGAAARARYTRWPTISAGRSPSP
jgi:transposase